MKKIILYLLMVGSHCFAYAQEGSWSEADRKYFLENLIRSRDELVKETANLSAAQSNFKENPQRWSINEVVEHLARYEMLFDYDINRALRDGIQPARMKTVEPDSVYLNFIMETKPHFSLDFSKPFTYTIPMGLNDLKANMAWFLKMRNESIEYVRTTKDDLRAYFTTHSSIPQIMIYVFGHTDRQLRQIKKIKMDPKYPGNKL